MNDEQQYQKYLNDGGQSTFEEFITVKSMFPQEFESKENSAESDPEKKKTLPETPIAASILSSPMMTAVPISNDLDLNEAQMQTLDQAQNQNSLELDSTAETTLSESPVIETASSGLENSNTPLQTAPKKDFQFSLGLDNPFSKNVFNPKKILGLDADDPQEIQNTNDDFLQLQPNEKLDTLDYKKPKDVKLEVITSGAFEGENSIGGLITKEQELAQYQDWKAKGWGDILPDEKKGRPQFQVNESGQNPIKELLGYKNPDAYDQRDASNKAMAPIIQGAEAENRIKEQQESVLGEDYIRQNGVLTRDEFQEAKYQNLVQDYLKQGNPEDQAVALANQTINDENQLKSSTSKQYIDSILQRGKEVNDLFDGKAKENAALTASEIQGWNKVLNNYSQDFAEYLNEQGYNKFGEVGDYNFELESGKATGRRRILDDFFNWKKQNISDYSVILKNRDESNKILINDAASKKDVAELQRLRELRNNTSIAKINEEVALFKKLNSDEVSINQDFDVTEKRKLDAAREYAGYQNGNIGDVLSYSTKTVGTGIFKVAADVVAAPIALISPISKTTTQLNQTISAETQNPFNVLQSGWEDKVNFYKDEKTGKEYEERFGLVYDKDKDGNLKLNEKLTYSGVSGLKKTGSETDTNLASVAGTIVNMTGTMMAADGIANVVKAGASSRLLGWAGRSAEALGKESLITKNLYNAAEAAQSYNKASALAWSYVTARQNMQTAQDAGLSPSQAFAYTIFQSAAIGAMTRINPDNVFFKEYSAVNKNIFKLLSQNKIEESRLISTDFLKTYAKTAVGENTQEASEQVVQDMINKGFNAINEKDKNGNDKFSASTIEDYFAIGEQTSAYTFVLNAFNALGRWRIRTTGLNNLEKTIVASQIPEAKQMLYDLSDQSLTGYTFEKAGTMLNQIKEVEKYTSQIPDGVELNVSQTADVVIKLQQAEALKDKIKVNGDSPVNGVIKAQLDAVTKSIDETLKVGLENAQTKKYDLNAKTGEELITTETTENPILDEQIPQSTQEPEAETVTDNNVADDTVSDAVNNAPQIASETELQSEESFPDDIESNLNRLYGNTETTTDATVTNGNTGSETERLPEVQQQGQTGREAIPGTTISGTSETDDAVNQSTNETNNPTTSQESQPQSTQRSTTVSSNGRYDIEEIADNAGNTSYEIKDKKGKVVTPKSYKTKAEYVAEVINQKEYPPTNIDFQDGMTEMDIADEVIDKSDNPKEIAQVLQTTPQFDTNNVVGSKNWVIAQVIGKVKRSSFVMFGDQNNITNSIARTYFGKGTEGKSIDQVAQEASEMFSKEDSEAITPQDIVDFMMEFPNDPSKAERPNNPLYTKAEAKFIKLTGERPSKYLLDKLNPTVKITQPTESQKQKAAVEYKSLSGDERNALTNEYNEWFNSLPLEQQISEYEYNRTDEENGRETTAEPSNGQRESNPNAGNQKDAGGTVQRQQTNARYAQITKQAFDALIEQLKKPFAKAFKNLNVTTDWNSFSAKAKGLGLNINFDSQFQIDSDYSSEENQIIDQAKSNGTFMKAPNGKATKLNEKQWVQTRTKRFKDWFGDWENDAENSSKAIDENGEPLVVYHATQSVFSEFKKSSIGKSVDYGTLGAGFYFTSSAENASNYANNLSSNTGKSGRENIIPAFINIRNPYDAYSVREISGDDKKESLKFTSKLKNKGFDGSKFEWRTDFIWYVAYEPNQIKSAIANNGSFSTEINDIAYMRTANGEIYGAKLPDGTIYINPEKLNANTAIHEFSHLWEQVMPNAWKKGVALFQDTKTGKDLYKQLKSNGNYSTLSDAQLWSEALNTHIGNYGEWRNSNPRGKMRELADWIKNIFSRIGNAFGIKSNPETTLRQFTERVVGDLLGGKAIATEVDAENSNQSTDFQIIGEQGARNLDQAEEATTRLDNLDIARQMETADKSAKEIRMATGWERGADKKWRYEIPDLTLKVSDSKASSLDNIIDAKELFQAYPELQYIDVNLNINEANNDSGSYTPFQDRGEDLFPITEEINISAKNIESAKSTLIHEIQHAIQEIEGFARGGSYTKFSQIDRNLEKAYQDVELLVQLSEENNVEPSETYRRLKGVFNIDSVAKKQSDKNISELKELLNDVKNSRLSPFEQYQRLSGETESRNVQTRADMSMAERQATLLSETEDVAREDQIILMNSLGTANSENLISNSNPIPVKTINDVLNSENLDLAYEKLQASSWYQNLRESKKAEITPSTLGNAIRESVAIGKEKSNAKIQEVKIKAKEIVKDVKQEAKEKIAEIKKKYAEEIQKIKTESKAGSRERIAKIRNVQKQAYKDIIDLITSDKVKRNLTPTESSRLIRATANILNASNTQKALDKFIELYNNTNSYQSEKQLANDINYTAKIKTEVTDGYADGKTLQKIYDENPKKYESPRTRDIAKRIYDREVSRDNPDAKAYEKVKARQQQVKDATYKLPKLKDAVKNIGRAFIREVSDRQFLPKTILKNINAKATYNRIISYGGASASAKARWEKIYKNIFADMTNADKDAFNAMVQQRRIISVDQNREARQLEPVNHPDNSNQYTAQNALKQMELELGAEKYNKLSKKADDYFTAFKGLLADMKKNGIINEAQYQSMAETDYQPRQFMQHLFDMEFDNDGKLISMRPITGESFGDSTGLSKDQIRSLQEGSMGLLMDDAELLLANAISGRTRSFFMNNVNSTFINKDFPKAKTRYETLKSKVAKDLTSEEKRFVKYFAELQTMVKENPMVGMTPAGNPKFLNEELPSNGWKRAYYFENGIRKEFFMRDDFYDQWHDTMAKFADGDVKDAVSVVSGSAVTKMMATGRNPGFALVNTPRDFASVMLFSEEYSSIAPISLIQLAKDSTKAIVDIYKYNNTQKDNLLSKYLEYGGGMDFLNAQGESPIIGRAIERVTRFFNKNNGINNKTKNKAENILDFVTLKSLSQYSETMFRVSVFDRSIQNQLKDLNVKSISDLNQETQDEVYTQGVVSARKIMDFNQGGRTVKALESVIPYINAATQGTRVAADSFSERPYATTARFLQGAVATVSLGYAVSMALIASFKDDDDERSADEIYLDIKEGLSPFQKRGYIQFVNGKKNEDGEYTTYKIAVTQPLTPFFSLAGNLFDDVIRAKVGRKAKGVGYAFDEFNEAFSANMDPFGISDPTKIATKNPIVKALATYASGYDFFRDQKLDKDIDKTVRSLEGTENKRVEDFYKAWGLETGMSPVRTKAAVEAMITSPDTNPFIAMTYGSIDKIVGYDSGFNEKKGFVQTVAGGFEKRLSAETSDLGRLTSQLTKGDQKAIDKIAEQEALQDLEANKIILKFKDPILAQETSIGREIGFLINKKNIPEIKKAQLIKKVAEKYVDIQTVGERDPKVFFIKYETYNSPNAKAEAIIRLYGKDFTKDPKAMKSLMINKVLTDNVWMALMQNYKVARPAE